jgi:hypothetical protein
MTMLFRGALFLATWTFALAPMASVAQGRTPASKICNIVTIEVPMTGNRMMVKCDSPATGVGGSSIEYFAVNLGAQLERAKLALSIMTTAKVAGRQVKVHYFSDDTTPNQWDMACNPQDCRPIIRIELM